MNFIKRLTNYFKAKKIRKEKAMQEMHIVFQ